MAQRTENEETEFKIPETLALCVNNCGVTANPATNNMCQNCFNATASPSAQIPTFYKFSSGEKTPRSGKSSRSPRRSDSTAGSRSLKAQPDRTAPTVGTPESDSPLAPSRREVNRCSGCRRKVGLTGFRCRCGDLFCAEHRYSDRHVCGYDYKAAGRDAIARENPVVKAAKILKV